MARKAKLRGNADGPDIAALTHRLAGCPRPFLTAPRIGKAGTVSVAAVVSDLIRDVTGAPPDQAALTPFIKATPDDANWLQTVLVASWLLHDDAFGDLADFSGLALKLFREGLRPLSGVVPAERLVTDPDRREELARLCVQALCKVPAGESPEAAEDRLTALDSVERHRVMEAARAAEAHARKVREAMEKRKAKEAAAKVMRE